MKRTSTRRRGHQPSKSEKRFSRHTNGVADLSTKGPQEFLAAHVADNVEVLYAIETALIHCYQDDDRVDDVVAMSTLRSMMRSDPPTTMPHALLFAELVDARSGLSDLSSDTWNESLRVAMDALGQRSPMRRGDTDYLRSLSRSVA